MTKSNIFMITLLAFILTAIIIGFKKAPEILTESVGQVKAVSTEIPYNIQKQNPIRSNNEYLDYKDEVVKKVRQNKRRIALLKEKITVGKAENDYLKPLHELEQRNISLISRVMYYKEDVPQNWEAIKHQFNLEINEIDKTIFLIAEMSYNEK